MKNLILFIAVIICCSCNKNKKYCWRCTVTYTMPMDTSLLPSMSKTNMDAFCNKTKDEIRQVEGLSFESGNAGYGIETYTNCTKK